MDKEKITKTDPSTLLSYIREIAKYLIQVFENEENDENEENESPTNHYEELIQKLEADVRQHIRVLFKLMFLSLWFYFLKLEQQLKLYVEKNQEKVDEYEKIGNEKSHKLTKVFKQIKKTQNFCYFF